MAILLHCIVDMSNVMDIINNKTKEEVSPEETQIFDKLKVVFTKLCELDVEASTHSNPYQTSGLSEELYTR